MSRVRIRFSSDSAKEGMGFQLTYQTLEVPTTAPVTFDFTQVQAQIGGGGALPVNQTVATTTVATSNFTDPPTQSMTSPTTTSGINKPLSAFTNEVTTNTDGSVLPSKSLPVTVVRRTRTETTHVVMVVEKKKVVEKVPDIIILGPSVPVVMIFVLVVAGIAWWNYKFDTDELNRYAVQYKLNFRQAWAIYSPKIIRKDFQFAQENTKNIYGHEKYCPVGLNGHTIGFPQT